MAPPPHEPGVSSTLPLRPAQTSSPKSAKPRARATDSLQASDGRLAGQVALITGGDTGVGREIARAFAREGAEVMMVCHELGGGVEQTLQQIRELGRRAEGIALDIRDEEHCQLAVAEAVRRLGRLDVLVNNAAAPATAARANLFSMFHLTKAALPHLQGSDRASIIHTTSSGGGREGAELSGSAGGAAGVVSFTRSLSQQLAAVKVRVNAVAAAPPPGAPDDPADMSWDGVEAYVYLASRESAAITGRTLRAVA